ncbi:hypothetical protein C8Q75DRAFT_50886 [Abortiporus biennis]|nr:hypothetical protein C8Q75DRAFT_50886 [Abortiporus biennis]
MKFSISLSSVFILLSVLSQQVSASPLGFNGGAAVGSNAAPPPAKASAAGSKNSATASAASSAAASSATSAAANSGDIQSSLTLDPSVIAKGFENDGQDVPTAGQVASLTSSNNFINFCATVPNLPITNGQQIKTGSCNPAPMGVIAATTNMPSSKFTNPKNGDVIKANTAFTISMAISHLETGFFVNANENYFSAPQFTNSAGDIQGHSHVVVELLDSIEQTTPTNPNVFAFFKGLNDKASNGVLSADVTSGLPAGTYRLASINTAANHQPVLVAIAQHGSVDDMVYFTVTDDGQAAGGAANSTAAAPPTATSAASSAESSAAAAATSSAAAASASSVNIKGANTGKAPGVQGGFANKNQNVGKTPFGQQQFPKGNNNRGRQFKVRRDDLNRL